MCLILLAVDKHPDYPLVVIANRDEFYARPTRALGWWPEFPQILAGQDLEGGGSWFGVTRTGHLAAVTNYREGGTESPRRPSRGLLVRDYLLHPDEDWNARIKREGQDHNGFNLIFGPWHNLSWASNRASETRKIGPGIHGLSNHLLGTPWPKVRMGMQALEQVLLAPHISPENLFTPLLDIRQAEPDQLPDTGISPEWEQRLSSIFIQNPTYGTRASTLLTVNRNGEATMLERSFDVAGPTGEREFRFRIEEPQN